MKAILAWLALAFCAAATGGFLGQQQRFFLEKDVMRFDGDQLWRLHLRSPADLKSVHQLLNSDDSVLDAWMEVPSTEVLRLNGGSFGVDVRVPYRSIDETKRVLAEIDIDYSVVVEDVQQLIDQEMSLMDALPRGYSAEQLDQSVEEDSFFKSYHTHDEILEFLSVVAKKKHESGVSVQMVGIGATYEENEITGLVITGSDSVTGKRSIVYHGGQHAREWIGVAVMCYFIRELTTKYGSDDAITQLLDKFEITIIPVMNVDGYKYTHSRNRMWRKNTVPTSIPWCKGVDTNRNWDQAWNTGGSSGNPCSDAYHGPSPFSEREPKAIADYILRLNEGSTPVVSYIDFHAFSQLWMTPFGSSCNRLPDDNDVLQKGGELAATALKNVNGVRFRVGNVCRIIYQASGGSLDWTYDKGNVKYSYAVELRDTGRYGFMLPADQIVPSGKETLAAVVALNQFIIEQEGL